MQLTDRHVRDLAWACFSPPLMITTAMADDQHNIANCGLVLNHRRVARLKALNKNPQPLRAFLGDQPPRRLGLYFEKLWHFFLQDDPGVELLAHNLPVRTGGQTLGEFDCLYYCRDRQRTFHLELAVKYYLGRPDQGSFGRHSPWSAWVGPNARDRLDLKLSHLLNHQSRLSQTDAGQRTLNEAGIETPAMEAEVKGWLYQPVNARLPLPRAYNAERTTGLWVKQSALQSHLSQCDPQRRWGILARQQWLSGADSSTATLTSEQLLPAVEEQYRRWQQPVQIAALDLLAGEWKEQTRLFVVDDIWPDRQQ